jgi:hypothetical protein
MTFEEWWKTVEEDVEDNCENRMDKFDACRWLRKAFESGQLSGAAKESEDE